MTNFAYVQNQKVEKVMHGLPKNWQNVSNFNVITDEATLNRYGWYTVVKANPTYNPSTQYLGNIEYAFINNQVVEIIAILEKPAAPPPPPPPSLEELAAQQAEQIAQQWNIVRQLRDQKMRDFEWRYVRHERQIRMNIPVTDNMVDMDTYMQALADITQQTDPFNLIWPEYTITITPEPVEEPQGPQGE